MRVSRRVAALAGVEAASLMIGTPSNQELLRGAGLLAAEGEQAGANDLVIAVRAGDERRGRRCDRHAARASCRKEIRDGTASLPQRALAWRARSSCCPARTSR